VREFSYCRSSAQPIHEKWLYAQGVNLKYLQLALELCDAGFARVNPGDRAPWAVASPIASLEMFIIIVCSWTVSATKEALWAAGEVLTLNLCLG